MTNMKINRFISPGDRPTSGKFGELYWNNFDNVLGVVRPNGSNFDLLNSGAVAEGKVTSVDTIADLTAIPNPATTVMVNKYNSNYDGGGGQLIYDADSTEDVDNKTVFPASPSIGGRFLRPSNGEIRASECGIISSQGTDQSQQFQDFITVAINNNWTAVVDVRELSCAGASIWANASGTPGDTQGSTSFYMRGAGVRSRTRIRQCNFTRGVFYKQVGEADPYWALNTNASSQDNYEDINFYGAVRLYNIEGSMTMTRVNVYAEEQDTAFYDNNNVPSDWSKNPAGWNDVDGNPVVDTHYGQYYNLLELLYLNHPSIRAMNVQFANNVPGTIGGMSLSQVGNAHIVSGRITHCATGTTIKPHPIYGGSGTNNLLMENVHYEDIRFRLMDIEYLKGGRFTGKGRPIDGWSGSTPAFQVRDTANEPERLVFDYDVSGRETVNGNPIGTAFQIDSGDDVTVAGACDSFVNGVVVNGDTKLRQISTKMDNVTTPTTIAGTVTQKQDYYP